MKKKIFLITLLSLIILVGCDKETNNESKIVENNGMLSYTIDGEKTDRKPSKEEGYIVNKIVCDNGSDMMWDNDNWEIELIKVNGNDSCKVDFTKDISKEGYRVTVTTNLGSALDSLSKATTLNGTVKLYSKAVIKSVTGCNALIENNKVVIKNITQNQTCNIELEDKTLANIVKVAYNANDNRKRLDFSTIDDGTHTDTPEGLTGGLYADEDDQGTTYYFSGDGTSMNNWVEFADKWWRIIRINGNGSVRLLYAGDGNSANDIGETVFNSLSNDPMYSGWKYGTTGSLENNRTNENKSTIYEKVEEWYNGLSNENKKYIDSEAIYCNDRSLLDEDTYSTSEKFHYAADRRFANSTPTFKCANNSDRFYNFGLVTADELIYSGGSNETKIEKTYYYLAKDGTSRIMDNKNWWTMTPCLWNSLGYTTEFIFYRNYYISAVTVSPQVGYIRPVISLKSEVQVTEGNGSADLPYKVVMP